HVAVRKEGLQVRIDSQLFATNLVVLPLGSGSEDEHFLVLFEKAEPPPEPSQESPPAAPEAADGSSEDGRRITRLEQELKANREYLQSVIRDLEQANEELQSANEEILSSNEELQSTNEELDTAKEELQSTNEELNTVNEDLHGRNEELSRVNSDLVNLLASIQIAIVIVSAEQRIRRFTPMAEKVLNLIPGDIGRPIGQIKPNINFPDLERLIEQVVTHATVEQRNVQDVQGKWYSLTIRPYRSVENRIDGAVLSLFEISPPSGS
ncbi:MAG TPA: PAS domain-containing protein, partial [Pirellulales bacterium]|nr:PAS domain-containing protein [Pirellulales bacterium]